MKVPNTKLTLMLTALAATVLCSSMAAQTFNSSTAMPIIDNAGNQNEIVTSGVSGFPRVRVVLNITHTWDADCQILLLPPSVQWPGGTPTVASIPAAIAAGAIDLCTGNGGSGDNFVNTTFVFRGDNNFDPTATATAVTGGTAPFTGTFFPEDFRFGTVGDFGSNLNGSWRMAICDNASGDQGTLTSWSIEFGIPATAEASIDDLASGGSAYASSRTVPTGGTYVLPASFTAAAATSFNSLFWTNIGAVALTASAGTTSALVNCAVTVTTNVAASTAAQSANPIVFSITPTAAGAFSFVFSVVNGDTNETPYSITISGTAVAAAAPEAQVERPSGAQQADGGTHVAAGGFATVAQALGFTLRNVGFANLTTTNLPAPAGLVNCTATVTTQPGATVAAGGTTTFTITVTPTAAGAWSFTWTFANNDANENPYNMTVQGTALANTAPEMAVTTGTLVPDGGTDLAGSAVLGALVRNYTIQNLGNANLTMTTPVVAPAGLVNCTATITTQPTTPVAGGASTTMTITITPTAAGAWSFTWTIANNDADENPYNATTSGTATVPPTAPECDVTRGGAVADGGTDTVTGAVAGTASTLTYTITNSGTAALTITIPVAAPGTLTNCTASITTQPAASTAPAGTTSLVVSVTPTAAGAFSCTITFANNDATENPYNWTASGTAAAAAAPECDVTRGGAVADGGTDTVTGGSAGTASVLTYTITNSGTAALTITTPVVAPAGLVNCTASISTQPAASTAAAGTTTLGVTVTPTAAGAFSCTVTFANNDATENPYNWTISGTATAPAPECDVTRGGAVADGGTDTVTGGVAATASVLTYTITNSGTAALTITTPVVAPAALVNCTATITTQPAASTAAAGTTTLGVTVTPTAAGAFSCTVTFANNDADENPYNWTISGTATGPAPEVNVLRGVTAVLDGAASDPLGSVPFGIAQTVTYTIQNTGTAGLNLTGAPSLVVVTAVANVTTVTVTTAPAATVAAAGSTTFVVTYTVTAAAAFSFTVSFANNDSDENPYNWTADGTGTSAPEMGVSRGAAVIDGGTDAVGNANFGAASTLTYTIANTGNVALTITNPVTIAGLVNCTATVATAPAASVAAAGTTTLVITVTPTAAGAFSFTVSVVNNDADENPYNWTVSGTGVKASGGDDDEGCTTSEGQFSWLMLAGVLASLGFALRMRKQTA